MKQFPTMKSCPPAVFCIRVAPSTPGFLSVVTFFMIRVPELLTAPPVREVPDLSTIPLSWGEKVAGMSKILVPDEVIDILGAMA